MNTTSPIILSPAQIAFIEGNVTMYAATAGDNVQPHVAKLCGIRVDPSTSTITTFLNAHNAGALLADIRAGHAIAVVFCEPGSEKAIQLKSERAEIAPLQRDDQQLMADYRERLIRHITPLGFSADMLGCFFASPLSEAVALQFIPSAAFDQTPGPKAGTALPS